MAAKTSKKPKKAPQTKAKKTVTKPQKTGFKIHWLQDVSLESPLPSTANFMPGQRELDFSAGVQHYTLPGSAETKIELRLRVYIHYQSQPLALAEICYSGVAEKSDFDASQPEMLEALYQHARPQLVQLLGTAGHQPPLPEKLNQ